MNKDDAVNLGLSIEEFERICENLGRTPNKLELSIFSAMWNEHCSYKSSKMHLRRLPTTGPRVLVGPGENAGIIDIGDDDAICFKIESHNHPSFIEPYQGAATGLGGILRDIFTMGARPIAAGNLFRFGNPKLPKTEYLREKTLEGISDYGNCFGVPTLLSDTKHHKCYNGNCLVNAFAIGHVKKDKIFLGKAGKPGDVILYVGAKTGKDGIHGSTMASDSFSEKKENKKPTVQVGDPFKEKCLCQACLEAFDQKLIDGIQDMGAAGLTCSTFEMAERGGVGIDLQLDLVPLRESSMSPSDIMLSESQERMLISCDYSKVEAIKNIFNNKHELSCIKIGSVISEPIIRIFFKEELLSSIPLSAVTPPVYARKMERGIRNLTSSDIIYSEEKAFQDRFRYDRGVGVATLADAWTSPAALVRIHGTNKAIAFAIASADYICAQQPMRGAEDLVHAAVAKLICSNAEPIGITNCLNFGNPMDAHVMWEFSETIDGIAKACTEINLPVVSGNVSFYNETDGESILPTPVIVAVGLIKDISKISGVVL